MTTSPLKLSDMGTSGLLQWVAQGEHRLALSKLPGIRAAKVARAAAIIRKRYGKEAESVFRKVARREAMVRDRVASIADDGMVDCPDSRHVSARCGVSLPHLRTLAVAYAAEHNLPGPRL